MDELVDPTPVEETPDTLVAEEPGQPAADLETPEVVPPPDDPEEAQQGYLRDSDYRKKTMALAEERRTFEAEQKELKEAAGRWDMFQNDPNYRQAAIDMVQRANGQMQPQTPAPAEPEVDLSQFDPDHIAIVEQIAKKIINQQVAPKLNEADKRLQDIQKKEVASAWAGLQKQHPEAAQYRDKIVAFLQANPGMESLDQAFFAVAGKDLLAKRQVAAKTVDSAARSAAQVTKSPVSSQAVVPAKSKSLADIVKETMDSM